MRSTLISLTSLACVLLLAGCGAVGGAPTPSPTPPPESGYPGWPPNVASDLIPIPVSTEIVVGPNRFLVNLIDQTNEPLATADRAAELRLYDLAVDPAQPAVTTDGTFMQTIQGRPGLYRAQIDFDRAGDWGLELVTTEPDGSHRSGRFVFSVRASGTTPKIGDPAPATDNLTASTPAEIAQIATDTNPDPDFYKQTVAQALAAHEPFVLVFATPAFCQTATCGPTLDIVKQVAADYKDRLTFINVEPYVLTTINGQLQPELSPDNLPIPVDAVNTWGLQTEPYTFVVDSDGKISAKFEGIAGADELRAAFDAVAN